MINDHHTDYSNLKTKVIHKNLGECFITFDCLFMQVGNPDKSSMFVEHDGEVKEVTKSLVEF